MKEICRSDNYNSEKLMTSQIVGGQVELVHLRKVYMKFVSIEPSPTKLISDITINFENYDLTRFKWSLIGKRYPQK